MSRFSRELAALLNALGSYPESRHRHMVDMNAACRDLLIWVDHLKAGFPETAALSLLDGARAAMLESVAYVGLGLGRATILAMRSQIDLLLGFTYFLDHPREWAVVTTTGDGFKLRKEIFEYHGKTRPQFQQKLARLAGKGNKGYTLVELYRILSAHIHGQSPLTVPSAGSFKELTNSDVFCESLIELQQDLSRELSLFLLVVFADDAQYSPPEDLVIKAKQGMKPEDINFVFFG